MRLAKARCQRLHEVNVPNPDAAVRCAAVQPAAMPAGLAKYSASSRQSGTVPSVIESWNETPGTIPSRMPGIVVADQVLLDRAAGAAPADRVPGFPYVSAKCSFTISATSAEITSLQLLS